MAPTAASQAWNYRPYETLPDTYIHNGVEFVSRKEAARRLGEPYTTLIYLVQKNGITEFRPPSMSKFSPNLKRPPVFYRAEDIAALIEQRSA